MPASGIKNHSCFSVFFLITSCMFMLLPLKVIAGPGGTSGGDLVSQQVELLKEFNKSGVLKERLKTYIKQVDIKTTDSRKDISEIVASFFNFYPGKDALLADIDNSKYTLIDSEIDKEQFCKKDSFGKKLVASTQSQSPNAEICFDLGVMSAEVKSVNPEILLRKFMAIAIHEHSHHFQETPQSNQQEVKLEADSRIIGTFLDLTAFVDSSLQVIYNPILDLNVEDVDGIIEKYDGVYWNLLSLNQQAQAIAEIKWAIDAQKKTLAKAKRIYDGKFLVRLENNSARATVAFFGASMLAATQIEAFPIALPTSGGLLLASLTSAVVWSAAQFTDNVIIHTEAEINVELERLTKIEQLADKMLGRIKILENSNSSRSIP